MARRPLTAAQRGIWFAQQLDPASPAYVTADCVELDASIDARRLAGAVGAALAEAEGLHARFGEHLQGSDPVVAGADRRAEGEPWQELVGVGPDAVTASPGGEGVGRRDGSARSAFVPVHHVGTAGAAEAWMAADVARPIDLACGALSRQSVLRLEDGRVWLYLAIHHLATDAYGTSLLLRRAAQHYAGGAATSPSAFGGLDTLLQLDAEYRASGRLERDRTFWHGELAGLSGAPVPGGGTPAAPASVMPLRRARTLPAAVDAPRALALVAIWLQRMTGAAEVVLGVPWMGRLGSAAARVPACWINVLPLRLAVAPHGTLEELTAEAAQRLRAAGRHGRYRYEELRRDLGLLGDERRLVGPLVNLKPFVREIAFGACAATVRNLAAGPVDDLTITLSGDRLQLEANPARYGEDDVAAHLERLALVLERGERAAAHTAAGRLEVARPADRARELAAARGPRRPVPHGTLASGITEQAARTPEAVAVLAPEATLTYAELHHRAETLARTLAGRGAGPGQVVGVALDRSAGLLVALLAVLRTGAAYLPLEPDAPADRTAFMLEDAAPVCTVDAGGVHGGLDRPPRDPGAGPASTDVAYVLYTSGSTGRPKGVAVGHRAIVNRLAWMQDTFAIGPGERVLLKTPLGFDVSVWELFWPLLTGAALVVAAPGAHRDPQALAATIVTNDVTTAHFVPSMLAAFVAEPAAASCTSLRRVVTSGEALGADLARRLFATLPGTELHNLYGPTEAAVDVTHWACDPAGEPTIPIGRPVWNTDAYVLDTALGPCPPGVVGELYLAGVQLADGYRGRPALTAERFVADPYGPPGSRMYRTGDLARRRPDGALEYCGRTDHQVKVRGVRIELGEVEGAMARHPAVAQAAVLAREDRPGDVRLVAYVVLDPAGPADPAALRRHAAALLPDAMVPSTITVLDALPVGPTGKLDRAALPAPQTVAGRGRAPAGPREQQLCELFAEALGVPRVAPDDGLFDLGGHSLLAARLAGRIRDALGVDLTIGSLFATPTPAALAARLDAGGPADAREPLLALRGGASETPALFCVHPAGGLGWCYAALAARLPAGRRVWALQADGTQDDTMDQLAARYVERVRGAQLRGPYQLLGWSVGGVIAHTMAVQLQEAGEEVGGLTLLDAYPGEQWRHLPPPDHQDALQALLLMGGVAPARGPLDLDGTVARLAAEGSALASLPSEALAAVVDTVVHTAGLMRRTEHRRFVGDLGFFTAAAPRAETWIDRAGWEPYVTGTLVNVDLACTHPELVHAAAAARIARSLGSAMDIAGGPA